MTTQGSGGITALHYAAFYGYPDVVEVLLEAKAERSITHSDDLSEGQGTHCTMQRAEVTMKW